MHVFEDIITGGGDSRREQVRLWVKEVVEHTPARELFLFAAVTGISPALFAAKIFSSIDSTYHALIEQPF